jgi:adenylate cyclase
MNAGENVEATFCFVDIAGYTALTELHGELAAANLVDDFNRFVSTAVEPFGTVHELIGDCAFLVFENPLAAHQALAALYLSIADRHDFPVVRAGLHHGPALLRGNRYFGSTVNTAARIAAQAGGGEILCTREVADLLARGAAAGIDVTHKQSIRLKNLPHSVDVYEIVLADVLREWAIDPVCKMQVDAAHAAGHLHFNNHTYWFCSLACVERFAAHPDAYV